MKPAPFGSRSEAYRKTRAVFVRHWIDLGRLTIHVSQSTIYIHGNLQRLPGVSTDLTPKIIDNIFSDLKRIPGTQRINARFNNWGKDNMGTWHKTNTSTEGNKSTLSPPVHVIKPQDMLENTDSEKAD